MPYPQYTIEVRMLKESWIEFVPEHDDSGVSFIHEDDAPEYSDKCFADLRIKHQLKKKSDHVEIYKTALQEIAGMRSANHEVGYVAHLALSLTDSPNT